MPGHTYQEHLDEALYQILDYLRCQVVLLLGVDVQVLEEAVLQEVPVLAGEVGVLVLHDKGVQDLLVLVEVLLVMLVQVGEVKAAPVIALEQLLQLDDLLILDAPEYGLAVRVAGCDGFDRYSRPVGHLAQRYEAEGLALEEVPECMLYGMRGPAINSVHVSLPPSGNS